MLFHGIIVESIFNKIALNYQKKYNIVNKDKINNSKRKYYEKNIHIFIWRTLLKRTIHQFNNKKNNSTINILGYTPNQLKIHLESKFTENMNWTNYGEWHVDHIRPITSFNIKEIGDPEFMLCWSLSNLQPLWGIDNIRKSNKIIF